MKSSKARKESSSKKMILSAVAILSTLCITLNSLPLNAEGAAVSEEVQNTKIVGDHTVEVESEFVAEPYDTDLALGYVRAAQAYADLFRYEDGLPWAEEALRLDPTLPEAHLIYGYLNFKLVRSEKAIAAFEEALKLDPTTFDAYLYPGIIHRGAGDPELGIEYFNRALEVAVTDEDLSTAYAERGLAYGNLDRYEESFADFETALTINPDNGWAILYRGIVSEKKAEQGNAASAESESLEAGMEIGFGS